MIKDANLLSQFNLTEYLSYLADHLESDSTINNTLDMSALDYASLFQRLLKIAIQTPSVDNFMTTVIISSIMLATGVCSDKGKEYQTAIALLFTYLTEIKAEYTMNEINSLLISSYKKLVDNYKLSKFGLTFIQENLN